MSNDFAGIGESVQKRALKIYWIVDTSGSMSENGKITELNRAIRVCIPEIRDAAEENVEVETYLRALKFSNEALWHTGDTKVADFSWSDLAAGGLTATGAALRLLAEELDMDKMGRRNLPPVLILISDGEATDDYDGGIAELMRLPWGQKAVRIAIAIGADANTAQLQKFCSHKEIPPLRADNATDLLNYIKWISTEVVQGVSRSQIAQDNSVNVQLSPPPAPVAASQDLDTDVVW